MNVDKTKVYEEEMRPHVDALREIARREGIPLLIFIQTSIEDDGSASAQLVTFGDPKRMAYSEPWGVASDVCDAIVDDPDVSPSFAAMRAILGPIAEAVQNYLNAERAGGAACDCPSCVARRQTDQYGASDMPLAREANA